MSLKNLFLQDKEKTGSKKEEEFSFGTAAEFKPDMAVKKILEVDDLSKLAHSNVSPFMLLWSVFYVKELSRTISGVINIILFFFSPIMAIFGFNV